MYNKWVIYYVRGYMPEEAQKTSRRSLLKAGLGVAGLAAGLTGAYELITPPQESPMNEDTIRASAQVLDQFLTREKPHYLVLGDTDHGRQPEFYTAMSHPAFLKVFIKHGFLDIAQEHRVEQSELNTKAAQGQINREDYIQATIKIWQDNGGGYIDVYQSESFRNTTSARYDFLRSLNQVGIVSHSVESHLSLKEFDDLLEQDFQNNERLKIYVQQGYTVQDIKDAIILNFRRNTGQISEHEYLLLNQEMQDNEAREKIPPEMMEALLSFSKERMGYDGQLATNIIQSSKGRPCLVFYGNAHINSAGKTVDELLAEQSGKKVSTISLALERVTAIQAMMPADLMGSLKSPDAALILNKGVMIYDHKGKETLPATQPYRVEPL